MAQLQELVSQKDGQISLLKNEIEQIKTTHTQVLNEREVEMEGIVTSLKDDIQKLEKENETKIRQLNEKELKKLAQVYRDQESELQTDVDKWFKFVIAGLILLLASIIVSAILSQDVIWYERFEYYLADFVFITFLIFSLKQYSALNRLRVDFANRKTLAQSYHNIISSSDDQELKNQFIQKAADVLCAPSRVETESYTVPEKVLEMLSESVKILSKK